MGCPTSSQAVALAPFLSGLELELGPDRAVIGGLVAECGDRVVLPLDRNAAARQARHRAESGDPTAEDAGTLAGRSEGSRHEQVVDLLKRPVVVGPTLGRVGSILEIEDIKEVGDPEE